MYLKNVTDDIKIQGCQDAIEESIWIFGFPNIKAKVETKKQI